MIQSGVGKRAVFDLDDLSLYNEYVDRCRVSAQYENFWAAGGLGVKWLIQKGAFGTKPTIS
ncbi:hypothetical protein GCM10027085_52410 [Spirosoma aerophilum]